MIILFNVSFVLGSKSKKYFFVLKHDFHNLISKDFIMNIFGYGFSFFFFSRW